MGSDVTVVPTAHQMAKVVAPLVGKVDPWVGAPAVQDLDVLADEVGDLVSLESKQLVIHWKVQNQRYGICS